MTIDRPRFSGLAGLTGLLIIGFLAVATAQAADVDVTVDVGSNSAPGTAVSGFKYLLQEDTTFDEKPGVTVPNGDDPDLPLSMTFHKSYHPVAKNGAGAGISGNASGSTATISDVPDGRYYLSVLPYEGFGMSGAPVVVENGVAAPVTVVVQQHPIPTARIAIYLFHDNAPINGVPDLPIELNPAVGEDGHVDWSQFTLFLEEPAGRYGIAGGQVIQDAFGNPLGTAYDPNAAEPTPLAGPGGCPARIDGTCADGTLHPNSDGTLLVENLAPGKYGIIMIPPTGSNWQQTSTIEGTKVIDAWVKANEPAFFVEFGPPGPHAFIGFAKSSENWVAGEPGGFPPMVTPIGETAATVSGTITDMHMSRSPTTKFFSGRPFPGCWVALNDMTVGIGTGIYAAPCASDSTFSIPDVPPGNYQLKVFDTNLDAVIATQGFTVDATGGTCNNGQPCDFGDVGVFNWFARLDTLVFNDVNENGFQDPGEDGIGPETQDVGLRWRDGTIYQNFPTDGEGAAPFDEMFPFFHWLVAEVSFGTKKATGATFVVDNGGEITADEGWDNPTFDTLVPQPQCVDDGTGSGATEGYMPGTSTCANPDINVNTGNNLSRTEQGVVLTTGVQGFLGQTSVMQFGKSDYKTFSGGTFIGENGGISGIVYNTVTRAEDEPQFAAAEEWEPGIPRVQLALYADGDIDSFPLDVNPTDGWTMGTGDIDWNGDSFRDPDDSIIDDIDGNGCVGRADVDNYPFDNFPGLEDVNRAWQDDDASTDTNNCTEIPATDTTFDLHDAIQVTWTDSWDDNLPTGCQGETFVAAADRDAEGNPIPGSGYPTDCFDGLRNFNQVRPAVFDGGYAFVDYDETHLQNVGRSAVVTALETYRTEATASVAATTPGLEETLQLGMLPGDYIVEAFAPPGYMHIKEEDKNVDFGDTYDPDDPTTQALAVECVGNDHLVPDYLTSQTVPATDPLDADGREPAVNTADLIPAPFAGEMRPLCDLKRVPLSSAQNAAAEFFMMTEVPSAANVSGVILNDLANEFDPNSPNFGEKYAPPWVPVGFYDWNGNEVNRVYADQYGRYDAVLPSTYSANLPMPSGMSPNMITACMNDAGSKKDASGNNIIDPFFDKQYSQFCYVFQYMPGVITYLDTPVVPIAAFAGPGKFPVDCERPANTPVIASVTRSTLDGPYVLQGQSIIVKSMGMQSVPNPEWDGIDTANKTVDRDYGFNDAHVVLRDEAQRDFDLGAGTYNAFDGEITVTVPNTVPAGDYQVVAINDNGAGKESPISATLTVDDGTEDDPNIVRVSNNPDYPGDYTTIQAAIEAVSFNQNRRPSLGALILVAPGTYDELVIMWKPVRLQGWGAGAVTINARQAPAEKISTWRAEMKRIVDGNGFSILDGQNIGTNFNFPAMAENYFPTEEGAAIFVGGRRSGNRTFDKHPSRIDGVNIIGASTGGGIIVNGYAEKLVIGNNRLNSNAGVYGGGIRIGHPFLARQLNNGGLEYTDAENYNIRIHHNHVAQNGGRSGAGGGISLHKGSDGYKVQNNWVCGNFSGGDGAGIGHLGMSDGGLIADNDILFNESFSQASGQSGGGVFVGGNVPLDPNAPQISEGSGSVTIDSNRIRGNLAGAGDGGGIRIASANGVDVTSSETKKNPWSEINVYNNMITNNVAALAGAGMSIQDSVKVNIRSNTIANNDSTATAGVAFTPGDPNESLAQPAGIVSHTHSAAFAAEFVGPGTFSDPQIKDNIVVHNRSFYWINIDDPVTTIIETGVYPASCIAPPDGLNCDVATADIDSFSKDLAVMNGTIASGDSLTPQFSMLSADAQADNSDFLNGYFNAARDTTIGFVEATTLQTAGAFDEGGNFLQVSYGPLSVLEPGMGTAGPGDNTVEYDYHLCAAAGCSYALNAGEPDATAVRPLELTIDFDGDGRPANTTDNADIGADEVTN